MIFVRMHDEGDCWDVTVQQSGDEILTFEFKTKKDAEGFAHRATNLFSKFFDVQLVEPHSSSIGVSESDSNQFGFRGRC